MIEVLQRGFIRGFRHPYTVHLLIPVFSHLLALRLSLRRRTWGHMGPAAHRGWKSVNMMQLPSLWCVSVCASTVSKINRNSNCAPPKPRCHSVWSISIAHLVKSTVSRRYQTGQRSSSLHWGLQAKRCLSCTESNVCSLCPWIT